ncbi:membrane integrity-associated transporter subunit PqiC [Hydrogenophaga sp.]|uniref:PqiC family protein n=1 Tax=Hydrogenophaga sp. TaxID=1904254 RepID=UPI0027288A23|nr:PqiC family protein [Hydrogenophaga sp.]MDO9437872.1 PqiC family protein [Hydrogenophaga sp.]
MKRRHTLLAGLGFATLGLTGCAVDTVPTRWYELRAEPPQSTPAARRGDGAVWEVAGTVRLPGALDRDTLVVASGASMVVPLTGHRWAEPLRDSIPARLVADLAVLRGEGLIWRGPAPSSVAVDKRLRVQIDALIADSSRRSLHLKARWWLSDERGNKAAPVLGEADVQVALADNSVDALAAGHRMAIWQLAQRIVGGGA